MSNTKVEQLAARTPTPWKARTNNSIEGSDSRLVAMPPSFARRKETSKANAEHIVKCVNAHDELVAALKQNMTCLYINNVAALERLGYTFEQAKEEVEKMDPIKMARAILNKLEVVN